METRWKLFDASKIHDAPFEMGVSLVSLCFECGDESRGSRDEVAFRFELTRKLADWTAAGGEVVGGEWKKEWRNLSLFRFSSLVTALAAHDPARHQGMYGLRRQAGGVPVLIISLYRASF